MNESGSGDREEERGGVAEGKKGESASDNKKKVEREGTMTDSEYSRDRSDRSSGIRGSIFCSSDSNAPVRASGLLVAYSRE